MESAREARRRKILERGSDRIALITAAQTRSETAPPPPAPAPAPAQQPDRGRVDEAGARDDESSRSNLTRAVQEETAPLIKDNFNSNIVTAKDGIEEVQGEKEDNPPPRAVNPPNRTDNKRESGTRHINPWIFSPAEIIQAFSDSEIVRLVFVVFFTFLVIKGFVVSKPMLILLVTDIAIVAGFIVLNKGDVKKHKRIKYNIPADKLGLAIEVTFLAQKVLGAIFMDFGIYTVIVICGMGF